MSRVVYRQLALASEQLEAAAPVPTPGRCVKWLRSTHCMHPKTHHTPAGTPCPLG